MNTIQIESKTTLITSRASKHEQCGGILLSHSSGVFVYYN